MRTYYLLIFVFIIGCSNDKSKNLLEIDSFKRYLNYSKEFYINSIPKKQVLINSCLDTIDIESRRYNNHLIINNIRENLSKKYLNINIVQHIIETHKITPNNGRCKLYENNNLLDISYRGIEQFIEDSLIVNLLLYTLENQKDSKKTNGLAISIYPINDFTKGNRYSQCYGYCNISTIVLFENIPECLCEWNLKHPEHPITRALKGKNNFSMNSCFY